MEPNLLMGQISDIRAEHMSQTDAFDKPCRKLAGSKIQYSTDIISAPIENIYRSVPAINSNLRWRI